MLTQTLVVHCRRKVTVETVEFMMTRGQTIRITTSGYYTLFFGLFQIIIRNISLCLNFLEFYSFFVMVMVV